MILILSCSLLQYIEILFICLIVLVFYNFAEPAFSSQFGGYAFFRKFFIGHTINVICE